MTNQEKGSETVGLSIKKIEELIVTLSKKPGESITWDTDLEEQIEKAAVGLKELDSLYGDKRLSAELLDVACKKDPRIKGDIP